MAVAPGAFVIVGMRIAVPGAATQLLRHTVIVGAVATASFGVPELAVLALTPSGPLAGIAAALAGGLLYVALSALAYPDAARTFARLATRG